MERYYQPEQETMSRSALEALQSERLVRQVRYVYDRVPLYRERMDACGVKPEDIHGLEDLHRLPYTSKQDLRDTYPYGMFAVPMEQVVRLHASSGTTGKQIVVGYTRDDLDMWAGLCCRQLTAIGVSAQDIAHVAFGYGLFTGGMGIHDGIQKLGAAVVPISSGNTKRQITVLQDFGCTLLCCTPSYAAYLGESLREAGLTPADLKLKVGLFGAEPWTEEMRREIEESLGINAYDVYGLTEVMGPGVAFECAEKNGMHVNEDHFILEVLDPETGLPVPDGCPGELVFTALTKQAFPVIRFRTKDIGAVTHEPCPCGRTFVRMTKPMGRTDDMLIIRGVNVFPSQIETVLMEQGYSSNYQIIVDRVNNTDTFDIEVEMPPAFFSDTVRSITGREKELSGALKSLLGISAKVRLVAPKSIQRSEGKVVRVIDRRKLH